MKNNHKIILLLLALITIVGLILRLKGISDNHSFWADEAYVASFARDVIIGRRSLWEAIRIQDYQPLQLVIMAISFAVLGVSEFAARIPFVVVGTLGIIGAYLLAARLSNKVGGLLAAFLYAFAQVNLANATQAKAHVILQTSLLFVLYLMTLLEPDKKKSQIGIHITIVAVLIFASLSHFLGILIWIPYLVFLLIHYVKRIGSHINLKTILFVVIVLGILFYLFKVPVILGLFFKYSLGIFSGGNNVTFMRELFWKNYAFITLPAIFGIALAWKPYKSGVIGLLGYMGMLLYLWIFKRDHNVRYLLPLFGVLFVYFSVFWAKAGELMFSKKSGIVCLLVAIIIMAGGYKVVRKPSTYYSPNADVPADIQIADYKTTYLRLQEKFLDLSSYAVFNSTGDAQVFYLPNHPPDATFMKDYTAGLTYGQSSVQNSTGKPIFTTLAQFKHEMGKYPRGIVIVEDWVSILPDEIKDYVKKNLKLELRVEGLPQAQGDNWPLSVYSWGTK